MVAVVAEVALPQKFPTKQFVAHITVPLILAEAQRSAPVTVPDTQTMGPQMEVVAHTLGVFTLTGNTEFPLPSSSVAVLTKLEKTPVYCLTCIGSVPSSAVAISRNPSLEDVPPTRILAWSLSAILPRTNSVEFVPATVATTQDATVAEVAEVAVVAFPQKFPTKQEVAHTVDALM